MSMVDRVAMAIAEECMNLGWFCEDGDCERLATAALQALREPTEEMIEAGTNIELGDENGDLVSTIEEVRRVWQAMIDAAAEGGE